MKKGVLVQNEFRQLTLSLLFLSLLFSDSGCRKKTAKLSDKELAGTATENILSDKSTADIKAQPFRNSDSTWGFTIYMNGKIYIYQQVIPGLKAATGFQSENDAMRAAKLVIKKIRTNISPENVNKKELDSLGIITKKRNFR